MEIIQLILQSITVAALVFAAIQIKITKKQLFLSTITKCVEDFRKLGPMNRETNDPKVIYNYIDLTNEELFYFQNDYLPKAIAKEWIDGMIDFIPLTNKNNKIINSKYANKYMIIKHNEILLNYPRIQIAFTVELTNEQINNIYDIDFKNNITRTRDRKILINQIHNNIKSIS